MNMPIGDDGCVHFTTILFSLIRESLQIKMAGPDEMDGRDEDLRRTLLHLWPKQARKHMHLLVPFDHELGSGRLTVGKIYTTTILVENWRSKKQTFEVCRPDLSNADSSSSETELQAPLRVESDLIEKVPVR